MTNRDYILKIVAELSDGTLLDVWESLPDGIHNKNRIVGICDGCPAMESDICSISLCNARVGPCGTTDDVRCALRDLTGQPVKIAEEENQ